ncbi:hypothetical protein ACVBEF_17560, partial [Glaciimonas sp. GG7]
LCRVPRTSTNRWLFGVVWDGLWFFFRLFGSVVSDAFCTPLMLVGDGPTAGHFLLLRQKKVTKEKATANAAALRVPKFSYRQPGLMTNSLRSNMSSA